MVVLRWTIATDNINTASAHRSVFSQEVFLPRCIECRVA